MCTYVPGKEGRRDGKGKGREREREREREGRGNLYGSFVPHILK